MVKRDSAVVSSSVKEISYAGELPQCLKAIEEMAVQLRLLLQENNKLRQENARILDLERENAKLREQVDLLQNQLHSGNITVGNSCHADRSSSVPPESDPFHEQKRLRSVVISGVMELRDHVNRIDHDCRCVMKILAFLGVECYPTAIYRLGRPTPRYPRKIKVVLPSKFFRTLAVKRSPLLRSFPVRGVSLRESLPLSERIGRRELRTLRGSVETSQTCGGPPIQNSAVHLPILRLAALKRNDQQFATV
ncbi:hypothetical protein Q1695_006691 [Nippostrongylus brasiliensis]|nr:hypothetical protein Q1695_006691 [Nippostrongylus brasiliensis]